MDKQPSAGGWWRGLRQRGGLLTAGTVAAVLATIAVSWFGLGTADHAVASDNASAWVWSTSKGELARVNGVTGRVDTRYRVFDGQGREVDLSQDDRYLILRDLATGQVSSLDLTTLHLAASMPTTPGLGITVAVGGGSAFVIDAVQGVIRQIDPLSLLPLGQPLHFPPGIGGGVFDPSGILWLVVPSQGTAVAVRPAAGGTPAAHGTAQAGAGGPQVARSVAVADPGHDLSMSVLDSGIAVLDSTAGRLSIVDNGRPRTRTVNVALTAPAQLPPRSGSQVVPVTIAQDHRVLLVRDASVATVVVPGSGRLGPAVWFAGRLYVPDRDAGTVHVLDPDGRVLAPITFAGATGPLTLDLHGGYLFVNAADAATARVVDPHGAVRVVDKYQPNILGGDPLPSLPPPPSAAASGPPGPPSSVVAMAGAASARVSWGPAAPNGAPVLRYVVQGGGQTHQVAATQRSITISGLVNGVTYLFTVYAVNAHGDGPRRSANPVVPTSDVPDPPTAVTATAAADGTVSVGWPAANGQGHKISQYQVTAISAGGQSPAGSVPGTRLVVGAGSLNYGTQYAFTVISVNDTGGSSGTSPVSNTVVPYTKPDAPANLVASTVDAPGTIQVSWQAAAGNGRAVTGYQVSAAGAVQTVTGTSVTLAGLGNGVTMRVAVAAVNAAGTGPAANASARTIDTPAITPGTPPAAGYNSITVPFTINGNGGSTTCTISVSSGPSTALPCSGATITGLWPATIYRYTVTVANKVGTASFAGVQTTQTLRATVICPRNTGGYCNSGIWAYRTPTQAGTPVQALPVGRVFVPQCWTSGTGSAGDVDAAPWGAKHSAVWIRFTGSGTEYFPWAWASLDGGDNYRNLPAC